MNGRLKFVSALVLCFGLIVGCSSSNNGPSNDTNTAENTDSASTTGTNPVDTDVTEVDVNADSTDTTDSAVPECAPAVGKLTVTGTTITGTVGDNFTVTGLISSDGVITGGFALEDGNPFATFDGMLELDTGDLVGNWADVRGCGGGWRATKVAVE